MSDLPPSPAASSVRQVAIALIVVGALDLILGILACCGRIGRLGQGSQDSVSPGAETGGYVAYVLLAGLSLPIGALVLAAGILLLKRKSRTLGLVGAIAAMVPLSCCFVAGIPVGIWTLMVLNREDVKALLAGGPPPGSYPPPPLGW